MMSSPAPALPPDFAQTRDRLHLLAARVLGAARFQAVGRIGLEVVTGGFGTPEFAGRRLDVVNGVLGDGSREHRLTSLGAAAEFAGVDLADAIHPALAADGDAGTDVSIEPAAAGALGDWYALSQRALERFAADGEPGDDVSAITLWPEHFDVALAAGAGPSRATYGGSPGDGEVAEPYLYVGPFEARQGEFWNASFGAVLTWHEVRNGADPQQFFATAREILAAPPS
jgi:hypothetical protein